MCGDYFMAFLLPKCVENCIDVLNNNGYEAFCVGGAVRDMLMGKQPKDFDIATNCHPQDTAKLFSHTIPTGIKHGTVTVVIDNTPIEVTTYRTEGGYFDSRHPDSVNFVNNIKEDLSRRDFTVNAIAYNHLDGIVDYFGGKEDIDKKILRTVGNSETRFSEDALRIMRLFRFASQLGFSIENDTHLGAKEKMPLLEKISAERIFAELTKLLLGEYIEKSKMFFELGALKFCGIRKCDITRLSSLPADMLTRFAALMILSNADYTVVTANLKTDNQLKENLGKIMALYNNAVPKNSIDIKEALCFAGLDNFRVYLNLINTLDGVSCDDINRKLSLVVENNEPYRICDLAVSGEDIKALGYSGKVIGEKLEFLRREVIGNPELNSKSSLISLIK